MTPKVLVFSTRATLAQDTESLSLAERCLRVVHKLAGRSRKSVEADRRSGVQGSHVPAPIVFRSTKFRSGRSGASNHFSGDAA